MYWMQQTESRQILVTTCLRRVYIMSTHHEFTKFSTVLMGDRKSILLKIHYFHVLTWPLKQQFHADVKNDLKSFHTTTKNIYFD